MTYEVVKNGEILGVSLSAADINERLCLQICPSPIAICVYHLPQRPTEKKKNFAPSAQQCVPCNRTTASLTIATIDGVTK